MFPARILVSGASGPIGKALLPALKAQGSTVVRLTRGKPSGPSEIQWDPHQPLSPEAISGIDAVVHLAGETIAGRWTEEKKWRIRESRVQGTKNLAESIANATQRPGAFVCASAIGYYGNRGDEVLREDSAAGSDFLSDVCREWEAAASPAAHVGVLTSHTRFGLVLSRNGGALPQMLTPFRLGVGGRIGNGKQWWSWVDIQDLAGAIVHVLKSGLSGPVNVVSPNPVTNAEFTKTLGSVLSRPTIFPVPAFAARLAFGQMADELLLASQKVEPASLLKSGYQFKFAELEKSLRSLLED
jgi:uncharacterized protein